MDWTMRGKASPTCQNKWVSYCAYPLVRVNMTEKGRYTFSKLFCSNIHQCTRKCSTEWGKIAFLQESAYFQLMLFFQKIDPYFRIFSSKVDPIFVKSAPIGKAHPCICPILVKKLTSTPHTINIR